MRISTLNKFLPVLCIVCAAFHSEACTTHCFDTPHGPVYGANLDLFIPADGLIFINKRGLAKRGFSPGTTGRTAEWVSRYGSVTFNLAGKEWAFGGMNEAGLVLGSLEILASEFPAPDERPPLPIGVFAQFILDTCSTVEEVVRVNQLVRIQDEAPPVHYLIADASGKCVSLEWFDGEFRCHEGEEMAVRAMSNMPYDRALQAFQRGGARWWWSNPGQSAERFAIAGQRGFDYDPGKNSDPVRYAFYTLTHLVAAPHTRWNIVYDVGKREIWYRTVRSPEVKHLDMKEMDFSCASPLLVLDVNAQLEGDVNAEFRPYDPEANRNLFRLLCERYGMSLSEDVVQGVSRHVDGFVCQ